MTTNQSGDLFLWLPAGEQRLAFIAGDVKVDRTIILSEKDLYIPLEGIMLFKEPQNTLYEIKGFNEISFSVLGVATNGKEVKYQWYRIFGDGRTELIKGATSAIYELPKNITTTYN